MIRQKSRDTIVPILENTHKRASNDHNTSINRLAEAIAGIAFQQQPTTYATLKQASTNTLMFDRKSEKFEIYEDLFQTLPKMQPEMKEAIKINYLHVNLGKEALRTF